MRLSTSLATLALAAALAAPAQAQKSADTLRVVFRDAVTNIDPYYNQLRTGVVISHQAWDGLVYRDPETFQPKPLLATSWKIIDDKTIEFELRRGVKFHNGDAFTADDVVYTLNLVSSPDSKVNVPANVNWIDKAEKLDDYCADSPRGKPAIGKMTIRCTPTSRPTAWRAPSTSRPIPTSCRASG